MVTDSFLPALDAGRLKKYRTRYRKGFVLIYFKDQMTGNLIGMHEWKH